MGNGGTRIPDIVTAVETQTSGPLKPFPIQHQAENKDVDAM